MKCQNCGKNEVNFKYTQIINGVKREMALCDKCAQELGLENMDFNMPINFSNFFSDFFDDVELLPSFAKNNVLECDNCKTTFDDFVNSGKFGCSHCYITFEDKILPILKNLHGSSKYVGRQYHDSIDELEYNKNKFEETKTNKEKSKNEKVEKVEKIDKDDINKEKKDNIEEKLNKLQKDLQKAIKDERYEDAAKIRDEINKINKKNN